MLETVIVVFHLLAALSLVVLVLLQQGKGAEAGASLSVVGFCAALGSDFHAYTTHKAKIVTDNNTQRFVLFCLPRKAYGASA